MSSLCLQLSMLKRTLQHSQRMLLNTRMLLKARMIRELDLNFSKKRRCTSSLIPAPSRIWSLVENYVVIVPKGMINIISWCFVALLLLDILLVVVLVSTSLKLLCLGLDILKILKSQLVSTSLRAGIAILSGPQRPGKY